MYVPSELRLPSPGLTFDQDRSGTIPCEALGLRFGAEVARAAKV
jgi:hypothetical protein